MSGNPILSIVTVTAYDHLRLTETIHSIPDFDVLEYTIVSPLSDEGTRELVQAASKERPITLVHDAGNGIYSAMNLGAAASRGKYVLFLNSGDRIANSENLFLFLTALKESKADWAICQGAFQSGPAQLLSQSGLDSFFMLEKFGRLSHQCVAAKREAVVYKFPLSARFHVAADTKQILAFYRSSVPLFFEREVIYVEDGAFSAKHNRRARLESLVLVLFFYPTNLKFGAFSNFVKRELGFAFRKVLRAINP